MIMDPIGDLLTRIRNAYLARKQVTTVPFSRLKSDILKILKKNKYITDYSEIDTDVGKKDIQIHLNNVRETGVIPTLRRVSSPGQRMYVWAREIRKSRNWKGIFILSTPKWVVTGYEARSLNVGWEILCEVYQ